jgi:hypothetical protein
MSRFITDVRTYRVLANNALATPRIASTLDEGLDRI